MLFFLTFYLLKNPEKKYHGFHMNIKQHNSFQLGMHDIIGTLSESADKGLKCKLFVIK